MAHQDKVQGFLCRKNALVCGRLKGDPRATPSPPCRGRPGVDAMELERTEDTLLHPHVIIYAILSYDGQTAIDCYVTSI